MLSANDRIGLEFEFNNFEGLKGSGFGKYIKFHNPFNPLSWKRKIGFGVDKVLVIGDYTLYIEEKFCRTSYPYRQAWFTETVAKRFKGYPHDKHHLHIVLTNKTPNFQSIQKNAENLDVLVLTYNRLVSLIKSLISHCNSNRSNCLTNKLRVTTLELPIEMVWKALYNGGFSSVLVQLPNT